MGILRQTVAKDRAARKARPAAPEPVSGVRAAVAAAVAGSERAAAQAVERVAAALQVSIRPTPAAEVDAWPAAPDRPLRTEWASMLADPVLPWFSSDGPDGPDGPVVPDMPDVLDARFAVSFAAPAEQGLWRDLSLASRVAAQVRATEARFEAAFDRAPTPLLIAAVVDGRPRQVLSANISMARLLGRTQQELLDLSVQDLSAQPPGQDLPALEADPASSAEAEPATVLCRWRHADGSHVPVRVRMALCTDPAEAVLSVERCSASAT